MNTEPSALEQQRRDKRDAWKALGFDYPTRFDRSHTAATALKFATVTPPRTAKEVLTEARPTVTIAGRMVQFRDMGKLAFGVLRDATGDIQFCIAKAVLGDDAAAQWKKLLDLGDIVGFAGELFHTKHGELTLMVTAVTPLSKALKPLPEKFHGLTDREAQYRQRYLDLATNKETFQRFQVRSQVIKEIRNYLDEKDFQEVETRMLQPQAGGAMARVFETHHNALDREFVLRIALELDLKMLTVGGMERVYEIGKCFRNEGTDPSHLQEFTMLEWYAAYADIEDNMTWTEDMLKRILDRVLGTRTVTVLDKENEPVAISFDGTWAKVRFPDLLAEYAQLDMFIASDDEVRQKALALGMPIDEASTMGRGNLLDFVYKKTARPNLIQPTFVMDYPSDVKPLARPNGDGTASCYQLLVAGWEVVNSYGELVNPDVQRTLLEEQAAARAAGDAEAMEVDEVFLRAMEHGMPPQTGFGMGIDRFVALITGQPNLRDVVLFPLMRPE